MNNKERMRKIETKDLLKALREVLEYEPVTGKLYWKKQVARNIKSGSKAGRVSGGYIRVKYRGRQYLGHRIGWALYYGEWPEKEIDHINGQRADNRMSNLRVVTTRQNGQNMKSHRNGKLCGAMLDKRYQLKGYSCWRAQIRVNGTLRSWGMFPTEQEAHEAYLKACEDLIQVESHYESRKEDNFGA